MRKSLKKIFRRHPDGTEHEYDEDDDDTGNSSSNARYSAEQRRSMGDYPGGRRSVDVNPTGSGSHRDTKNVQSRLSGSNHPLPGAAPESDDDMVNNVLYHTRGQDGPVVRGMDEPESPNTVRGYGGYGLDSAPTIRTVDDNPRSSQDRFSNSGIVPKKPVPPRKSDRRSIDEGRPIVDDGRNYKPKGNSDSPVSPVSPHYYDASEQAQPRSRSIDRGQASSSNTSASSTAAFYNVPDRKPVRRSIDENRGQAVSSGSAVKGTPPRSSSLRNSMDATGTNLAMAGGAAAAASSQNPRSSRQSIDDNRKAVDYSVRDTGFNAPHGLLKQSSRDEPNANVATYPNMASSSKMEKAPHLATSPDIARSSNMAGNTATPTTIEKPNGTSAGWPLVEHNADPVDTKYSTAKQINVADGPLAVPFAEKYSEPDKFSSQLHVHKDEKVADAVVHERIQPVVHEIVTEQIDRHIHTHEVRVHVQPILHQERLPDRHWVKQEDGSLTEITAQMADVLKLHDGYKEADRFDEKIDHRGKSNLNPERLAGGDQIGGGSGGSGGRIS